MAVLGTNASETLDALDGVTNGRDTIFGFGGNDSIFGLGGDDVIIGGIGADTINGGNDTDTASYSDSDEGVNVSLLSGRGIRGTAEGDTLIIIENLTGSAHNDGLTGNHGSNVLRGLDGWDRLSGLSGDDALFGDIGNDTLMGGFGADRLDGGSGSDTANYFASTAAVAVSLITDEAFGGDAEGDQLDSIEHLTGSRHDDILWGNDVTNTLRGMDGDDNLKGFGGNDMIDAGDGDDTLWGMGGYDGLRGGDGADTISGGAERDYLYGESGADVFRWDRTSETGLTIETHDVIWDFNRLEGDVIDLSGVDADIFADGNQTFTFIGTAAFSGAPGEVRYYYAGSTYIEMQTGAEADAEGEIVVHGMHTPDASWFVL